MGFLQLQQEGPSVKQGRKVHQGWQANGADTKSKRRNPHCAQAIQKKHVNVQGRRRSPLTAPRNRHLASSSQEVPLSCTHGRRPRSIADLELLEQLPAESNRCTRVENPTMRTSHTDKMNVLSHGNHRLRKTLEGTATSSAPSSS